MHGACHVSTRLSAEISWLPLPDFYEASDCANQWVSKPGAFSWAFFLLFFLSNSNVLVWLYLLFYFNLLLFLFSNEKECIWMGVGVGGTGKRGRGIIIRYIM